MTTATITPAQRRRAVAAGAIGNFVEYFDFISFGAMAVVLAPLFFPSTSPTASLLSTFATFAVAFVFRPLGGLFFGYIGDRLGRRASLSSTVLVMSASTFAIGLLPTASDVGVWASVLLVIARCLQGLAAGGEWSGSVVYIVEFGDKRRRSFFASLTPAGANLGALAGVGIITVLNVVVGPDAVADWAWRIPFLIAAPLGLIGLYMRTRLQDTPAFEQLKASGSQERTPIRQAFRHHKTAMLVILVGSAAVVTSGYLLITFMVSFLTSTVGVPKGTALLTNTIAIAVYGAATVLAGLLSDRFGRSRCS